MFALLFYAIFSLMNLLEAEKFLSDLELGEVRVVDENLNLNVAIKEKILSLFSVFEVKKSYSGAFVFQDKIPLRSNFGNFRVVPGAIIRKGAFIDDDAVIMPSFLNIGAFVGSKTMIDSFVTVGACAFIGNRCHVSSSSVIAGVLEPASAYPVIIEDDVFIGAHCLVSEGMRVKKGAVLASGVHLTASTKIIDRETGENFDYIPEYSLVVPGSYVSGKFSIQCALIVKKIDQDTRKKTSINELLRSFKIN